MSKKLLQVASMSSFLNQLSEDTIEKFLDSSHDRQIINMPTFTLHILNLKSKDYLHKTKVYLFESVNKIEPEEVKDLLVYYPNLDGLLLMTTTAILRPNMFNFASEAKMTMLQV